jgi:hypothetical protein
MGVMTGGISTVAGVALYTKQALEAKFLVQNCFTFLQTKTGLYQYVVGRKGFGGDHQTLQAVDDPRKHKAQNDAAASQLHLEIDEFLTDSDSSSSMDSSQSNPDAASSKSQDSPSSQSHSSAVTERQKKSKTQVSEPKLPLESSKLTATGQSSAPGFAPVLLSKYLPSHWYIHLLYISLILLAIFIL